MFTFFFAVLIALSLFACNDKPSDPSDPTVLPTEGTGYGLVHGHYVGEVKVNVGSDGKVTGATVEEYFLPYSWAKVDEFRTAYGYGLVHGHYVGMASVLINNAGTVISAEMDEYFLPYSWAKVDEFRTATGYGLVHGHYVGVVDVTLANNGNVVDINVEEYFLPYSAAKVVVADPQNLPADVLSVTGSRGTSYYAKYFSVDGILFTGTVLGEGTAQSIKYSATDIDDIEVWVETEANAKRYVEAVDANLVFIANQDGTKSTYEMADASAKVSMKKSESPYWSGEAYPLGWAGNIAAFETAVTGTKLDADLATIIKDSVTKFWSIGDLVTGATMTDFIDYYQVAQRAHTNALTAIPDDILPVVGSRGTSYYAKYINVDGITFTGEVLGTGTAQSIKYSADGIEDIEVWVETEANAKRYVEAVEAGNYGYLNADGEEVEYVCGDASAKVNMRKSLSPYWSGASYPLGWAGNIAAFNTAITGTKLDADLATIIKNSETKFWSIGDLVTGATMTDFIDYYQVAQRAHTNALTAIPDDILTVVGSRGTSYYAKYILIDGKLFTGTVLGEGTNQSIRYSATGIADIEVWVQTEANAKAYVDAVKAGNYSFANAAGEVVEYVMGDASAKVNIKKSLSGYWSGASYPLGWAGNIAAFITGITGTEMNADLATIVKNSETKFWSIGTIVTGATMTDFIDYYQVAQRAYNNAE